MHPVWSFKGSCHLAIRYSFVEGGKELLAKIWLCGQMKGALLTFCFASNIEKFSFFGQDEENSKWAKENIHTSFPDQKWILCLQVDGAFYVWVERNGRVNDGMLTQCRFSCSCASFTSGCPEHACTQRTCAQEV